MPGRYFNPRVYEGSLYTPPVEIIAGALEQAQKKYDVNFAASEKLRNQYIQSRTVDRADANALQDSWNKKVDAIAAKYSGDYSAATKDLYALQSEISRSMGPGGQAAAIQGNYLIEQKSLEDEKARLAKGEITQQQFNNLQTYYQQAPKTALDPSTNTYSTLNPIALAKYVDHSKIYKETLDKTKPRTISYDKYAGKDGNGNLVYQTVKQQGIDPQELSAKFQADLLNDDQFMNYAHQTAAMQGIDVNTYLSGLVQDYNQKVIPRDSGLFEDTRSTKLYDDFNYREGVKFGHQLALKAVDLNNSKSLAKFKKGLDNESEAPSGSSILVPATGVNSMYKPVDPQMTVYGNIGGLEIPIGKQSRDIDGLIKQGQNPTINVPLLASIKEANPKMKDTDIWAVYNDSVTKNQDYYNITMTEYKTTSSQQEEANRLMPSLATGRRDIYKVDSKTGQVTQVESLDDRKDLAKAWANDKNPLKSNYGALGKTRVNTGKVPFGTVMPDPNGKGNYYIVKENRSDFDNLQRQVLNPAFDFIHQDSRRQGDPFDLYIDNKPTKIMGRKEYSNGRMQVIYYPAIRSGNGYQPDLQDPLTNGGRPVTPEDMENMLIPQQDLMSTFPAKTSKSLENELERQ